MERKERFYSLPELQKILEVSSHTLRGYISSGQLPAVWIGNGLKVSEATLKEFLGST